MNKSLLFSNPNNQDYRYSTLATWINGNHPETSPILEKTQVGTTIAELALSNKAERADDTI